MRAMLAVGPLLLILATAANGAHNPAFDDPAEDVTWSIPIPESDIEKAIDLIHVRFETTSEQNLNVTFTVLDLSQYQKLQGPSPSGTGDRTIGFWFEFNSTESNWIAVASFEASTNSWRAYLRDDPPTKIEPVAVELREESNSTKIIIPRKLVGTGEEGEILHITSLASLLHFPGVTASDSVEFNSQPELVLGKMAHVTHGLTFTSPAPTSQETKPSPGVLVIFQVGVLMAISLSLKRR